MAAASGPRTLLKRLREVMAEPMAPQERLDRVTVLVAATMQAQVCSVYVLRIDNTLELYATQGLKAEAVHNTVMLAGEGLVSLIARDAKPINLADVQSHPAYSYKPETGEENFHSFLGVPILRAGITLGVLVVQNTSNRLYTDEEVDILQTTAMVMAEMLATREFASMARPGAEPAIRHSLQLEGLALNEGLGLGYVVLHEPKLVVTRLIADNIAKELKRLDSAIEKFRADLDDLLDSDRTTQLEEHREILEAFRMFAHDRGWIQRIREAVQTGLTAEAAVERVQSNTRARWLRQTDPYLRERLHDLDDMANRLLRQLMGKPVKPSEELPDNAVIVARSMGPAALLEYDRLKLRGLVLEEGGPTSHVAIIARALGIAAVGQVPNVTGQIEQGDAIIVDGSAGCVHIRPQPDVESAYVEKVKFRARRQAQYRSLKDKPAVSRDGQKVELFINAGLLVDLPHIEEAGADGVGLFRTELQFMVAPHFPNITEQCTLYKAVLDNVDGKPVTFRTLDIGGDKILPYMPPIEEENPALGWRAIRLGLDRPGLLRSQIRALLKAAGGRNLRIMFPMISTPDEFDQAKAVVLREVRFLRKQGHDLPEQLQLGAMLEVPALLFQLEDLFEKVDFLSVGTNDLLQFFFASDRGNIRVSGRFDTLSVPVLRALKSIIDVARRHGKGVTVCGELASKPLEALALLALGYRSLSLSPSAIGPVKAMILSADVWQAAAIINPHLEHGGLFSVRTILHDFARSQGIHL